MAKKIPPIKYTDRDFASIRDSLVEYAKRYYPNTFKDFNEASFGMMMLENVSYVGDILSFYTDYQANESFFESAIEYQNVVRHARTLGYKFNTSPSSMGFLTFFIIVPAQTSGLGPNTNLIPLLKRGSEFASSAGNVYVLIENVDFSYANNEIVVARVNETTGVPTSYAIKARGRAVSGKSEVSTFIIGEFQQFLKLEIGGTNISEIMQIIDDEGHEYFEVEHLSQDIIFKEITNRNDDSDSVKSILKPVPVPRRFVIERERDKTFIQFGYGSDSELSSLSIADPANVVLQRHGRDFISDTSFDPTKILDTDKFGIAPSNTILTILYRINTTENVNASIDSINDVRRPIFRFANLSSLNAGDVDFVMSSIEVTNEESFVGDVSIPSAEELKIRAKNYFVTQKRAVTLQDYKSLSYNMPNQFGAIKRVNIVPDNNSFKRNLNMYIISENFSGQLINCNSTLKNNLKNWISTHKMVNDTIDILNARVINFAIEFQVIGETNENKYTILQRAITALKLKFINHYDIGEPIFISSIYNILNEVDGVEDTTDVRVYHKVGGQYSTTRFDFDKYLSADGRVVRGFENIIFELKFPNDDIKGSII